MDEASAIGKRAAVALYIVAFLTTGARPGGQLPDDIETDRPRACAAEHAAELALATTHVEPAFVGNVACQAQHYRGRAEACGVDLPFSSGFISVKEAGTNDNLES